MPQGTLNRREVVQALLRERGDLLVIAGLGATAWDVASVGDDPLDFPLWGAMGGAAMMGLGLALARRIVTRHRGNIVIVSTPGKGTMVSLSLPIAR